VKIAIHFHCAVAGCTTSAAAELDHYLGLPPAGWTYRMRDGFPAEYFCPEHAQAVEAEEAVDRRAKTDA